MKHYKKFSYQLPINKKEYLTKQLLDGHQILNYLVQLNMNRVWEHSTLTCSVNLQFKLLFRVR